MNQMKDFLRRCRSQGIVPTRFVLLVNIAKQTTSLFEKSVAAICDRRGENLISPTVTDRRYSLVKKLRCSTSRFGIGEIAGSNMTPRGLHRVAKKIGGGWPVGTYFKEREFTGYTWQGFPLAPITTRIMWLEGLEPGFNRGGNRDSFKRYIYIHGTGDALTLGRPASHGCVHLAADDLIPLYDKLPEGTLVWISER